jgi:putative phosphotransacetylase
VELAQTDARKIGIKAPLRLSGNLRASAGCVLVGPEGSVILEEGVIIAKPHLHLHTSQGEAMGIADGDIVDIYFKGLKAGAIFGVIARVSAKGEKDLHLDTDEANAFLLANGQKALVITRCGQQR